MPSILDAHPQSTRGTGTDSGWCPPMQVSGVVLAKSVVDRFSEGDGDCAVECDGGDDASSVTTATTIDECESSSSRWDASSPSESSAERGLPRIPARSFVAGGEDDNECGAEVASSPTAVASSPTIIPSKVWVDAHLDRSKSLPRSPSRSMRVLRPMPFDDDERLGIQDDSLVARHSDYQGLPTLLPVVASAPCLLCCCGGGGSSAEGPRRDVSLEPVPGARGP